MASLFFKSQDFLLEVKKILEKIIKLLAKGGVKLTSDIKITLDISDFILESMLIALEKQGYIKSIVLSDKGSCGFGCHHCNKLSNSNKVNLSTPKMWILTKK